MAQESWHSMITDLLPEGETIVASTLTDDEAKREFCIGFGSDEGKPFTAWSETRVFFPVVYDGSEWVGSVPRNPCAEASDHHGGQ